MKNILLTVLCLTWLFSLSGCGLMEDAFKAGVFFALVIIAIVGLLIWILRLAIHEVKKYYSIELKE